MSKRPAQAPTPEGIAQAVRQAKGPRGAAPVHLWNPPFCGDLDMRISRDGTWIYQGTPIGRPAMVQLFSSILKKEGEKYFLVTPVEKVGLIVDDAPFVAIDFEVEGEALTFVTNVGDRVKAGNDNPIRVDIDPATGAPAPYILIRANLEALIDRKTFYRLVERGETAAHDGDEWFGVRSCGEFFPIIRADELA